MASRIFFKFILIVPAALLIGSCAPQAKPPVQSLAGQAALNIAQQAQQQKQAADAQAEAEKAQKADRLNSELNQLNDKMAASADNRRALEQQIAQQQTILGELNQQRENQRTQLIQNFNDQDALQQQGLVQQQLQIEQLQRDLTQAEKNLQRIEGRLQFLKSLNYDNDLLVQAEQDEDAAQDNVNSLQQSYSAARIQIAQSSSVDSESKQWEESAEQENLEKRFDRASQQQSQQLQNLQAQYQKVLKQDQDLQQQYQATQTQLAATG